MPRPSFRFLVALPVMLLAGCTFMNKDFANYGKNYDAIPLDRLSIGQSQAQVTALLGKPANVIGAKAYEKATVTVWAYERWLARPVAIDRKDEEYWLFFLDDKLRQWGKPGEWEREADRVYEIGGK